MAEAAKTETKKRRGPTGPRQERPTFAVVSYIGDNGEPQKLDKNRLSIRFTKDPFELVRIMESGDGTELVKEVESAKARQNPAEAAAQSTEAAAAE